MEIVKVWILTSWVATVIIYLLVSAVKVQLHQAVFASESTQHAMQNVDCVCKAVKWDRPQSFHQGIPCSYLAPQRRFPLQLCFKNSGGDFFCYRLFEKKKKNINLYPANIIGTFRHEGTTTTTTMLQIILSKTMRDFQPPFSMTKQQILLLYRSGEALEHGHLSWLKWIKQSLPPTQQSLPPTQQSLPPTSSPVFTKPSPSSWNLQTV